MECWDEMQKRETSNLVSGFIAVSSSVLSRPKEQS